MIAIMFYRSKTRLLACILWSIVVCSTAVLAQNSSSNSPKNCAQVVLTAEEQAFWQNKVFTPVWKDSCDHTLMTGAEIKCLFLTHFIQPTLKPNAPNDLENPIFNKVLDDERYGWNLLSPAATYPHITVPFGYKVIYPKGCKH